MKHPGFVALMCGMALLRASGAEYIVCVSNERAGTISVLNPAGEPVKEIAVGKRPRGLHSSPDGRILYVAVSGSPIGGPPKLEAQGNPILEKEDDDDADHEADGIAVVDLERMEFVKKLAAGSDPEEFAVVADGKHLWVSNEDVATASLLNVESGKVEAIVPVKREPEGVSLAPDGRFVYVTCEAGGEVFVIDAAARKEAAHFTVGGRPRSVAFTADGMRAFIPSESSGKLHLIDAREFKVVQSVQLPPGSRPMKVVMSPDGKRLFASTGRGGTVLAIDPRTLQVTGRIKAGARPWGMGFSPGGEKLFVANGPSNDISVIDPGNLTESGRLKAGNSPWGIEVVRRESRPLHAGK